MRKMWILVLAIILSCLFGSGYFYFFSVLLNDSKNEEYEVVNSGEDFSYIYYNQLGVYENTSKMDQEVLRLALEGIHVYTFKKGNLTVYVSHVSNSKSNTLEGQTELTNLGYSFILKEISVLNQEEVSSYYVNNDIPKVLEVLYEN